MKYVFKIMKTPIINVDKARNNHIEKPILKKKKQERKIRKTNT